MTASGILAFSFSPLAQTMEGKDIASRADLPQGRVARVQLHSSDVAIIKLHFMRNHPRGRESH